MTQASNLALDFVNKTGAAGTKDVLADWLADHPEDAREILGTLASSLGGELMNWGVPLDERYGLASHVVYCDNDNLLGALRTAVREAGQRWEYLGGRWGYFVEYGRLGSEKLDMRVIWAAVANHNTVLFWQIGAGDVVHHGLARRWLMRQCPQAQPANQRFLLVPQMARLLGVVGRVTYTTAEDTAHEQDT